MHRPWSGGPSARRSPSPACSPSRTATSAAVPMNAGFDELPTRQEKRLMVQSVTPQALRAMYDDGGELAVVDVREEGVYSRDGHLLRVSNIPLSVLELRAPALLPRKSVRIVTCDGGEGLAARAAEKLSAGGYTQVSVLDGGTPAWKAAGGRLYTGVYVPSKAFGEYIQHEDAPPEVTATELDAWMKSGRDMVVVDSRPLAEFKRNSIPGAYDCPSA